MAVDITCVLFYKMNDILFIDFTFCDYQRKMNFNLDISKQAHKVVE